MMDSAYAKYIAPRSQDQSVKYKEMDTIKHTIPKKKCDEKNTDSGGGMVKSCGPRFVYSKAKYNAIINEKRFKCTSNVYTSYNSQGETKAHFKIRLTY